MRKVNAMFHIEGERLVKTSNGEDVPEDEPVFILRARDQLARGVLRYYYERAKDFFCTDYLLNGVKASIAEFDQFSKDHPERMKQPGVTRGK